MGNTKAIVTLAIGDKYLKQWEKLCKPGWSAYANKYGYDLICIDQPLDNSARAKGRSPAWQKCLILSQEFSQNYERLVWIDSDILINPSAPCVVQDIPVAKVGATDVWSSPTPQIYAQTLNRKYSYYEHMGARAVINRTARDFYANYGLEGKFDRIVQTGVLVLSPYHHRNVLEKVYLNYEDKGDSSWNYEMRPLSWELLDSDCVHWIDHRFNLIWFDYLCLHYPFLLEKPKSRIVRAIQQRFSRIGIKSDSNIKRVCANTAFLNSFFLHFAGCSADMSLISPKTVEWHRLTV